MSGIPHPPKVLYVDDEVENLVVFKSSFRRNYEVLTANSGLEAQKILDDQYVDVVISDQRMPNINGLELLSSIPDEVDNVRIILTGYTDIQTVIEALNSGKIHRYISKPWDKLSLMKVIDEELSSLKERRAINELSRSNAQESSNNGKDFPDNALESSKEVIRLKRALDESYNYLLLLSEIGQEIIQNRSVKAIIEKTYDALNNLLDATVFACGVFNAQKGVLEYTIMEEGQWLSGEIKITDEGKAGTWTFNNKKEIFSNNWIEEAENYLGSKPTVVAGRTLSAE